VPVYVASQSHPPFLDLHGSPGYHRILLTYLDITLNTCDGVVLAITQHESCGFY
jgi:hypothetical protein